MHLPDLWQALGATPAHHGKDILLGPPVVPFLTVSFFGEGEPPTKIDDSEKKKGYQLILTSLLEDLG